jgi:hypothetical protein
MTNRRSVSLNSGSLLLATALIGAGLSGLAPSALAQAAAPRTEKPCDVAGLRWNDNPVFRTALHPSQRERGIARLACAVEEVRDIEVGPVHLRFTRSKLYDERVGGPVLASALVTVETLDAGHPTPVGRLFLGPDPIDGGMHFAPQAVAIEGGVLTRLSPRHRWLYRLDKGVLTSLPAFDWRASVDDAFPDNAHSGENLAIDLERMVARIAVRKIANDPLQGPASAYEPARMVVVDLAWAGERLVARSARVEARTPGENELLDRTAEMDEEVKTGLKGLPAGTEPCSLGAWSNDPDPRGMNVRATPDIRAKVLGIVPPPRKMPKDQEVFGSDAVKAEFRIIGFKSGWFLIENIEAPGVRYDVSYPRHLPQPFKGRGWVNARLVGAAYANGGLPEGRLYLSPHADASYLDAHDSSGNPITADGSPARILACSGWWGLIETREGQRGWKRTLCSNQVTNCS